MAWILTLVVGLAVAWLVLALVLFRGRPEPGALRCALRLLPDTARLIRRVAADPRVPRATRLLLWLLIVYLLSPIDLVPDFVPVIGFADDLVLTGLVLRHLVARSGPDVLAEHWPGNPEGLRALRQVLGLGEPTE